jgi:hypothetical protein
MKSFVLSLAMAALLCTVTVFSDQGTVYAQPGTSAITAVPGSLTLMLRRHRVRRRARSIERKNRHGRVSSRRVRNGTRTRNNFRHGRRQNRRDSRRSIGRAERRHSTGRASRRHSRVYRSRNEARGSRRARSAARSRGRVRGRHGYGRRGTERFARGGRGRHGRGRQSTVRHGRGRHDIATRRVHHRSSPGAATAPGPTNNRRAELKRRYPEIRH